MIHKLIFAIALCWPVIGCLASESNDIPLSCEEISDGDIRLWSPKLSAKFSIRLSNQDHTCNETYSYDRNSKRSNSGILFTGPVGSELNTNNAIYKVEENGLATFLGYIPYVASPIGRRKYEAFTSDASSFYFTPYLINNNKLVIGPRIQQLIVETTLCFRKDGAMYYKHSNPEEECSNEVQATRDNPVCVIIENNIRRRKALSACDRLLKN